MLELDNFGVYNIYIYIYVFGILETYVFFWGRIESEKMWPSPVNMQGERMPLPNKLVAVAIDKDKGSQIALKWTVDHLLARGQTVLLIHVKLKQSANASGQSSSNSSNLSFLHIYVFVCVCILITVVSDQLAWTSTILWNTCYLLPIQVQDDSGICLLHVDVVEWSLAQIKMKCVC